MMLALLLALVVGAAILGGVAGGVGARGDRQRAADLAAVAGAAAMRAAYPRLFEPGVVEGRANPGHLERAAYLVLGRNAAQDTAARNGARTVTVTFPDPAALAPVRIRVAVEDSVRVGRRGRASVPSRAVAEAELVPPGEVTGAAAGAGAYRGPVAERQGKKMRPDVAVAFDRMAAAARREAGLDLIVTSALRDDAEQARLYAAHPDPHWVAPPGHSLHRLGTELDLAPPAAYAWLAANASRFHFTVRYPHEPWHLGFTLNAGSASVGFGARAGAGAGTGAGGRVGAGAGTGAGAGGAAGTGAEAFGAGAAARPAAGAPDGPRGAMPGFVPPQFAPAIARAAQRWNVSAAVLAAQLYVESRFNPFARSPAGAQGIAQFMPATARGYGLRDPLDPDASIDAQAHYLRDLLRTLGAVPLALAAYNAGPERVRRCGCIPPFPETQAYVAQILGLLHGAGDPAGAGVSALTVRLVA